MQKIAAEDDYKESFVEYATGQTGWQVEIIPRHARPGPESAKVFIPEKKRWLVERS